MESDILDEYSQESQVKLNRTSEADNNCNPDNKSFHGKITGMPNLCTHEVIIHGICTDCLKVIPDSLKRDSVLAGFISNDHGIFVSKQKAASMESEFVDRLLKDKKLCLILDLDNTLIHASSTQLPNDLPIPILHLNIDNTSPNDWMNGYNLSLGYPHYADYDDEMAWKQIEKIEQSVLVGDLEPGIKDGIQLYIKLRPYVIQFLSKMSRIFELYLFTMGTEQHAIASLNILDPTRRFFGHRVFSRNHGFQGFKSLKRIFPFNEDMVIILDDTEAVWGNLKSCIKVHGYYFFPMMNTLIENFYYFLSKTSAMLQSYAHHYSPSTRNTLIEKIYTGSWSQYGPLLKPLVGSIKQYTIPSNKKRKTNSFCQRQVNSYMAELDPSTKSTEEYDSEHQAYNSVMNHTTQNSKRSTFNVKAESYTDKLDSLQASQNNNYTTHSPHKLPSNFVEFDIQLLYLEELLTHVHETFFHFLNHHNSIKTKKTVFPKVADILTFFREDVLKGIILNFESNQSLSNLMRNTDFCKISATFGALLSNDSYTHSIEFPEPTLHGSCQLNTDLLSNKKRVHLMWLEYAIYTWRRPDDKLFDIGLINKKASSFWEIIKNQPIGNYHSTTKEKLCSEFGLKKQFYPQLAHTPDSSNLSNHSYVSSDLNRHKFSEPFSRKDAADSEDSEIDTMWEKFWDDFEIDNSQESKATK